MIQRARRGAREGASYVSALWGIYKAGQITYKKLMSLLRSSKTEQRKAVKLYSTKGKSKGEVAKLRKQVKEISKALETERAIHVHRIRDTFARTATVNTMSLDNYTMFQMSTLETAMANLRYFDPGTNALVTANPATGTYQRDIMIKSLYCKMTARNNYQVPCKFSVHICVPKIDTSLAPGSYYTDGLTDQGAPTANSPLVHLTDSQILHDAWRVEKTVSKVLNPGQELVCSWSFPSFLFDPSLFDTHASYFQKKYGGCAFVTRVEGVLGHDTAASEYGFLQSAVDVCVEKKIVFEYDAGKSLHDISISDSADTFTNGGVVSNKPVSDNQGYSVA